MVANNIIITNDGKRYEKPSLGLAAAGYIAGSVVNNAVQLPIIKSTGKLFEGSVKNVVSDFSADGKFAKEAEIIRKAAKDAFIKSDLAKKGVEILDANAENSKAVYSALEQDLPKLVQKIIEKNPNIYLPAKNQILANVQAAEKGFNAFYTNAAKKIVFSNDKNPLLAFHEMGHALNFNTKGFGKLLSSIKVPLMTKVLPLVALVALCKRKKVEGEQPKNGFDKVTTFIKNNCGKLAFLCALPTVMEEGLATIKGLKLAKNSGLSESLIKQIRVLNTKGLISYIGLAVAAGVATTIASKVRDMIEA